MGRPEGAGCYCAVNHLLRQIVDGLAQQYDFVVMDNEAGMEHLSRRTTRDVDVLLLVTDPTMRGFKAAEAMVKMAGELEINVGRLMLVVNRVQGDLPPVLREARDGLGIELSVGLPSDPRGPVRPRQPYAALNAASYTTTQITHIDECVSGDYAVSRDVTWAAVVANGLNVPNMLLGEFAELGRRIGKAVEAM